VGLGLGLLMASLETAYGDLPALLGVDYEHDAIFTPQQLTACNRVLKDFAARGGLITINWSPQSPWANDESDLVARPGTYKNTRSENQDMSKVHLSHLVDPQYPEFLVWRKKLDRVAAALKELQEAGIPVLWRPLQEMNGFWFWWGCSTQPGAADGYRAVWKDMFHYFSQEKGLDNLLWVYSPASYSGSVQMRSVTWAYPGDDLVDIVAGTAYNDRLEVSDYSAYLTLGKPLGMAEYGADSWGPVGLSGTLDNRTYLQRLKTSYPRMAYWVAWHDWDWGNGTSAHQSLATNQNTGGLFADPRALTLSRWKATKKASTLPSGIPGP